MGTYLAKLHKQIIVATSVCSNNYSYDVPVSCGE